MANPVGRPSEYRGEETIQKSLNYIKSCIDNYVQLTTDKGQWKVNLPKSEGLAIALDVSRETLYQWAKEHQEFADILEHINKIQVDRVFNEALAGNYNATIAKLLLAKHGYKEATEVDHGMTNELKDFLNRSKGVLND